MLLRRIGLALTLVMAATMAMVVAPALPSAGQTRAVQDFTMTMTEGELSLRDSEEPLALTSPTVVSGTQDDVSGVMSSVAFSTPTVEYDTVALGLPVNVNAEFTEVSPGTGIGSVNSEGVIFFQTTIQADLHLVIGDPETPSIVTDCLMTPIVLQFESVAPYVEGQPVTVSDPNFTLPPAQEEGCDPNVIEPLNDLLAGSGHSISLTLQGDLQVPPFTPPPGEASLAVDPTEATVVGDPVTLSATVVPGPDAESEETPTGFVDFMDGNSVLATVPLEADGTAELVTTDLPAGPRQLKVRYRGDGNHGVDVSDVVVHDVSARPNIDVEIPAVIQAGGDPIELEVSASQTGFGADVEDARMDVTIRREGGTLAGVNVVLERWDGATWVPVPLTNGDLSVLSRIGTAAPPADLPADGEPRVERFRLTAPANTPLRKLSLTFELVEDNGGAPAPAPSPAPDAIATATGTTTVYKTGRIPTTISLGTLSAPITPVARPGYDVAIQGEISPNNVQGAQAGGTAEVRIGGRLVATVPVFQGSIGSPFVLPADTPPGLHDVFVRYLGDANFGPSETVSQIQVHPPLGARYECNFISQGFSNLIHVQVEATALVPSVANPGPVSLTNFDLKMSMSRSTDTPTLLESQFGYDTWYVPGDTVGLNGDTFEGVDLGFGPGGTGTVSAIQWNGFALYYQDLAETPDMGFIFDGESGTVEIEGEPGEVVPVTLDEIKIRARSTIEDLPLVTTCVPEGEPLSLGDVTVAGTTLTVEAPEPTRSDDDVALTATVAPATSTGIVEFLAGTETVGVAPVEAGVATSITTLPVGEHDLKARFYAQGGGLSSVSEEVPIEVLVAVECSDFTGTEEENVVRLVYMELLLRCPEQGGFDYWVGQLEDGVSPETFARAIAFTDEALDQVVIDAYQTALGRDPSQADLDFWRERFKKHGAKYQRLLAELSASGEFFGLSGRTRAGLVNRVYDRLLDRAPSAADLDYWTGELLTGRRRSDVMYSVSGSPEALGVIVVQSYDEILSRAPTTGERTTAIQYLIKTGSRSGLYTQLIGTQEFWDRAQTLPNPED